MSTLILIISNGVWPFNCSREKMVLVAFGSTTMLELYAMQMTLLSLPFLHLQDLRNMLNIFVVNTTYLLMLTKSNSSSFPKHFILWLSLLVLSYLVSLCLWVVQSIISVTSWNATYLMMRILLQSPKTCRKANHLLHIFSCCDPSVKTQLFSNFCLSINGAALWRVSCPQHLRSPLITSWGEVKWH